MPRSLLIFLYIFIKKYGILGSYSKAARLCDRHRSVVKRIVEKAKKEGEEGFKPRSKKPKNMPNKTPARIKKKIMEIREEMGYGAIRISRAIEGKGRDLGRDISS